MKRAELVGLGVISSMTMGFIIIGIMMTLKVAILLIFITATISSIEDKK